MNSNETDLRELLGGVEVQVTGGLLAERYTVPDQFNRAASRVRLGDETLKERDTSAYRYPARIVLSSRTPEGFAVEGSPGPVEDQVIGELRHYWNTAVCAARGGF